LILKNKLNNNLNMIKVNHDLCIGCGTCEVLCPAVFKLNAEGKAEVISSAVAEASADKQKNIACAKNAAESCATQAIEVK